MRRLLEWYVLVRLASSARQRERTQVDAAQTAEQLGRQMALLVQEAHANARLVRRLGSAVLVLALVNVTIIAWVAAR